MVIQGYLWLIVYMLAVLFVVGGVAKRFANEKFSRKIVHILTGFCWFIYDYFFGCSIHQIIICAVFVVLAILSKKFNLIKTIEVNSDNSNGTIYYSVALFCLFSVSYFVPRLYEFVGFAILLLAVGDGFATIVGRYVRSVNIYKQKTLLGFLSCFVFGFVAIFAYNKWYCSLFSTAQLLLIAYVSAICEEQTQGLDNVTVTFGSFVTMLLLCYVPNSLFAVLLFCALFTVCFFTKIMTFYGSFLSAFIGASLYYVGGVATCLFAVSLYTLLIVVHFVRKIAKAKDTEIVKKTKGKDAFQVLANGFVSTVALYLYYFTGNCKLLVVALTVFANSFVDSLASDVGSLSKRRPYDIFNKKFVDRGQSGGMSVLGSATFVVSAFVFSFVIEKITNCGLTCMLISFISMILCCMLDTLFGATLQVKYVCNTCGLITEKETHCGQTLQVYSGNKFFNNDTVNFICSFCCFVICLLMLVV